MQLDMHFYGIYALARAAGIKPDSAYIIAYASQFVDDALDGEVSILANNTAVYPIITSHIPMDYKNTVLRDQWKVWVPFHFLPGNMSTARSFYDKMVCLKATESKPAAMILQHALSHKTKPFGLHLAGITAHVYADTFAHYGFVGLSCGWNKVKSESVTPRRSHSDRILKYIKEKFETFKIRIAGTFAQTVPVGHGAVATYPDRPYLKWQYLPEDGRGLVKRENPRDYLKACELLYGFLVEFLKDNAEHGTPDQRGWNSIKPILENILSKEGKKEERIDQWREAISGNALFQATQKDRKVNYSEDLWQYYRISGHLEVQGSLGNCDASHFIHAAWRHRNYVLYELLPEVGIVAG
jgi:hypothetical protein